jgi:histidine triad (HIT) family protein
MIDKEQEEQIKKQLIQQIESTFPENKKKTAIDRIKSMENSQLEEFLIQNNLIKDQNLEKEQPNKCIFCSIIKKEIPSYKIDENKDAIAILEINPISEGHVLVISKEHKLIEEVSQNVFSLTKKIAKKIKTKLKPRDINISLSNLAGHGVINILPIYKNETLNSQRYSTNKEELEKVQRRLEKKPNKKEIKKKKLKSEKLEIKLPNRIP